MPLAIVFSTAGTYTIDDDGIRGNNTSVVRNSAGVATMTFEHPADTLTFTTITPGVNLIFNTPDSFGSANVTVGSLTDAAQSPDSIVVRHMRTDGFMTLVSNGSISEGGTDTPADIIAAAVVLSAATGIGTPGNALETQTTFIEAETNTGGIKIANYGNVQIGGITSDAAGLNVANSGNINFSTVGFIYLSDTSGEAVIHGGDITGNVTLTAIGADSDIYAPIDMPAVYARGGGVTFKADRDVLLGSGGANYNNDILATTFVNINAGHDFILDGTSDIRTGAFGGVIGGPINIQAGHNINLSNTTGALQTIQAFAGNVTLTTGPGGAFIENAAIPGAISTTDDIILNTDMAQISSGGLNTTGIGSVTIRPVTPGWAIDIGSAPDLLNTLTLSDAEFDLMFTLNVNIGDANSGPVEFSAPITPFIVDNMVVRSATEILVNSSITLARTLTLHAGDNLFFTASGNFTSTNGGLTVFVDESQKDGGVGGIADLSAAVISAKFITVNGNVDDDTLIGSIQKDALNGGRGADHLNGNDGNDQLNGGRGVDHLRGGAGNDTYIVDVQGEAIEGQHKGTDTVRSTVNYSLGANLERLELLGGGALSGTGNTLGNRITGNSGANILNGLQGNDTLIGKDGADKFDFTKALGAANIDTITDFATGVDLIRVDNAVFTGLAAGALPNGQFHIGAAAVDGNDHIIYNSGNGRLFFDVDGLGGADKVQFATLDAGLALTAGDFFVI